MLKPKSLAKISFLAIFLLILDILTLTATPNAYNKSSVLVIQKAQGYEDKPLRLTVTADGVTMELGSRQNKLHSSYAPLIILALIRS